MKLTPTTPFEEVCRMAALLGCRLEVDEEGAVVLRRKGCRAEVWQAADLYQRLNELALDYWPRGEWA